MNDADRTSIHEAMEQQSISISKAGIITTLQARCAIIAAANPLRGRYNTSLPFGQNVQLTEPILSRFDVLCVVKDQVDPVADERLAKFVVGSHIRSHPCSVAHGGSDTTSDALADELQSVSTGTAATAVEIIPQDLLRKYIFYARTKCHPALSHMDVDKVSRLYADLRKESLSSGSIPITVRHIESVVRMAEAHAKMHLRDHVRADDIDLAIRVALESFIQSQKYSVMNHLRKAFSKYISYRRDHHELLAFLIQELSRDALRLQGRPIIDLALFEARAKELHIHEDLKPFYGSRAFQATGFKLDSEGARLLKSE
jgi:DNA replication licensing factor MCM2